jgi:tetratricopeptide (TPR) repeat protein
MSEMLGNQYFMTRNYKEAVRELEAVYLKDSKNKSVQRKLIIAYTQIGKLMKALELFILLVNEDVNFIINAEPIFEDSPHQEIKKQLKSSPKESVSPDVNIYNAILWLYYNPEISIEFLEKVSLDFPENIGIKESIKIIKQQIKD